MFSSYEGLSFYHFPGAPIQFVVYTQELPPQQQPLTMAVHQAEGPQPQIILTSSWWPLREEGGPVLHSWWPPSPPSFSPHNTWLHRLPGKLDSNSSSACLGVRFPICWTLGPVGHSKPCWIPQIHWIHHLAPAVTPQIPHQLLSSPALLLHTLAGFPGPKRKLPKQHRECGRAGSQLQTQMLPSRGRE